VDEVFFLGGIEKRKILEVFRPHIFFDDQLEHIRPAAGLVPCVHVPFGIANTEPDKKSKTRGSERIAGGYAKVARDSERTTIARRIIESARKLKEWRHKAE
jgi:hypothetical protein